MRRTLWKAADDLRVNSTVAPSESRGPILGLIFRSNDVFVRADEQLHAPTPTR